MVQVATPREGAGRAERARRPTAGPGAFKIRDAESKANSLFGGYSAGGSRARGARPATDSAGNASFETPVLFKAFLCVCVWILDKKSFQKVQK